MAKDIYINAEKGPGTARKILIFLLFVLLLTALVTGAAIWYRDHISRRTLEDFSEAIAEQKYEQAREIYHKTQERALAPGLFDFNQERDAATSKKMEEIISSRLEIIREKIESLQDLAADDLEFAEGMGELTAVDIVAFLRRSAAQYLRGEMSRKQLDNAFALLGELENVKNSISDLPDSFTRIDELRPDIQSALQLQKNRQYWQAYNLYLQLLAGEEISSFIYDQIWQLRADLETEMYAPLVQSVEEYISGGRYITAFDELKLLQNVYTDDALIKEKIEMVEKHVPTDMEHYTGVLEFVSIRPLIVQPERAFDKDAYAATAADAMLTVNEFAAILEQLHANDYILVDSDLLYTDDGEFASLYLPSGKKPLVLVIDGLNYYASRRETGNSWDLVIDEDGNISAVYPDESGQMRIDRRGEAIGILDEYVRQNPDFSLNGARGTISLTGYECIFGKITDPDQVDDRNWALQSNGMLPVDPDAAEIEANRKVVIEIIDRLKSTGWCFASSTYGYIDARSQSLDRIIEDTQKWLEQVGALTGPVRMLNYPHGSFIPGSDERAEYLREQGFVLFAGQGPTAYNFSGQDYVYVDKTPLNGFSLRNSSQFSLDRFFDADLVYDRESRPD